MINENTLRLLNIFGNECQGLGYKVFSFSELKSFFPESKNIDEQTIKENIQLLSKHAFINVKHLDEMQVCLSVLDKGRQVVENNLQTENNALKNVAITWAFLGSLMGSGVVALIFGVLVLILGGM